MKKKLLLVVLIVILAFVVYFKFFNNSSTVNEAKMVKAIEKYNYNLYDNQPKTYKKLFNELNDVLNNNNVDEEKYVSLISQMFIMDFYTLQNKLTNLNIGGVEFVYSGMVDNFKMNANDTLYKYVESNIYGDRKQNLPVVTKVNVDSIKKVKYNYNNTSDYKAYEVKVNWEYEKDLGYEKSKTLYFIHEDKKLSLVEMS